MLGFAASAAADPSRTAASPSQAVYGQVGAGDEQLGALGQVDAGGGAGPGGVEPIATAGGDEGDGGALPFTGFAAALVLGIGLALLVLGAAGRALSGRLRRG
jgi:hypothetical protein